MKGIILAGGEATRLYPITKAQSKALLPVYNKPMIYYPLSVLMLAKIREVLIITNPEHVSTYKKLLGDGERLGIEISYDVQDKPRGIAEAFMIGEDFIGDDDVCLILGDNLLHGHRLPELLTEAKDKVANDRKSVVFGFNVTDPQKYGIATVKNNTVVEIQEKPRNPKSNWCVIGLYMFTNDVIDISKKIKPSERGELEITSVNNELIKRDSLDISLLGRGYTWFDTGNVDDLYDAASFVKTVETRQGLKIGCLEEIAYYMGFITKKDLFKISEEIGNKTEYSKYLNRLLENEVFKYDQ